MPRVSIPGRALADGGQASRTWARRRRRPVLTMVVVTVADSPRRTRESPERLSPRLLTGAASSASATIAASSRLSIITTVTVSRIASRTRTQSRATTAARPLSATARSPRDRDGGKHPVEHALGGGALELGLGAELDPVPQRGAGQCLNVVGDHVVAARQPGPGPAGRQQRG